MFRKALASWVCQRLGHDRDLVVIHGKAWAECRRCGGRRPLHGSLHQRPMLCDSYIDETDPDPDRPVNDW